MIPVFYLEETDRSRLYLRRFSDSPCPAKPGTHSFHDTKLFIGESSKESVCRDNHRHDDDRWPTHCACGYMFRDDDSWQLFTRIIYRRFDTGEEMVLDEAPVGACWNAEWLAAKKKAPSFYLGDDKRCLLVRTPGGDWVIDARANNCTQPDDHTHKCWVRHGRPEDGTLHVDKQGLTCGAGTGSIVFDTWHGFLHHGHLHA